MEISRLHIRPIFGIQGINVNSVHVSLTSGIVGHGIFAITIKSTDKMYCSISEELQAHTVRVVIKNNHIRDLYIKISEDEEISLKDDMYLAYLTGKFGNAISFDKHEQCSVSMMIAPTIDNTTPIQIIADPKKLEITENIILNCNGIYFKVLNTTHISSDRINIMTQPLNEGIVHIGDHVHIL